MPEGVAGNFFGDSCASHCRFDGCLYGILVDVMAAELLSVSIANMFLCSSFERLSGVRVEGQVPGGKQILPTEFLTGLGPFDCQGVRQPDPAGPGLKILLMKFFYQFDLMFQIGDQALG